MKVYAFGNQDLACDNKALKVINELEESLTDIEFVVIRPNEDLPFIEEEKVVIIDTVEGIKEIKVFDDIDKLVLPPRTSVHDFDLGFQLKYLKKLGKLGKITIIGIPAKRESLDISLVKKNLLQLL